MANLNSDLEGKRRMEIIRKGSKSNTNPDDATEPIFSKFIELTDL